MPERLDPSDLRIVPANRVTWQDLQTIFGTSADPSRCWCQRYRMLPGESWASVGSEELALRLRDQADCDHPRSRTTTGLVALLGDEPVGWCAVAPRSDHPRLLRNVRVPWEGRTESRSDDSVWAVTCFVTRTGYRRRRISYALAQAAVDFARDRGARAIEGYPMTTKDVLTVELHPGTRGVFEAAGFTEVSHPTLRRVVMRIDL